MHIKMMVTVRTLCTEYFQGSQQLVMGHAVLGTRSGFIIVKNTRSAHLEPWQAWMWNSADNLILCYIQRHKQWPHAEYSVVKVIWNVLDAVKWSMANLSPEVTEKPRKLFSTIYGVLVSAYNTVSSALMGPPGQNCFVTIGVKLHSTENRYNHIQNDHRLLRAYYLSM